MRRSSTAGCGTPTPPAPGPSRRSWTGTVPTPGNNSPATSREDPDEAGDGGPARRPDGSGPPRRPATAAQVRALGRLAGRWGMDLEELVGRRFDVAGPEELSIADASRLIDELQQAPAEATV